MAAGAIAAMARAARPIRASQTPIGWMANAALVLSPSTARPTTQDGAAQHTTHVIVVVAAPASSVPPAAAVNVPTRVERLQALRAARTSTMSIANSIANARYTKTLDGSNMKLHSAK